MPIPFSQSLRAHKGVVIKITWAKLPVPESVGPFKISIADPVGATLPNDYVADGSAASEARTATVPTSVARVVTVNKPVHFFLLASAASLGETRGRQCGEQEKARDYQQYLAIAFH